MVNLETIYGIINKIDINKAIVVRLLMKVKQSSSKTTYVPVLWKYVYARYHSNCFSNMRV